MVKFEWGGVRLGWRVGNLGLFLGLGFKMLLQSLIAKRVRKHNSPRSGIDLLWVWCLYGVFDFSCDVLGLLEIHWVWVCVLCVLNLEGLFLFIYLFLFMGNLWRSLYFVDLHVPYWHVLDFFNFLSNQNILFEEEHEHEHVLHDDWEEHNVFF